MIRRLGLSIVTLLLTTLPVLAQQPPPEGFVPASSLPPGEQLPAAPFLVGSYALFLVLMLAFLWSIWQRIGKVEKELIDLERRQAGPGR
jgi:hypothetical protein